MSTLTIKTGTEEDFFQRGRQLARAADRGEALPSERTISFEDPADVVKLITTARLALFRAMRPSHINSSTSPKRHHAAAGNHLKRPAGTGPAAFWGHRRGKGNRNRVTPAMAGVRGNWSLAVVRPYTCG